MLRPSQSSSKLFLWHCPSRNRHSLAARPLPSQELCRALLTRKDGTCFCHAGSAQLSQTHWLNCYSDCALCASTVLHISNPICQRCLWLCLGRESPLSSPKSKCCAPVMFNAAWSHFSAGNSSGGVETCARHSMGSTQEVSSVLDPGL